MFLETLESRRLMSVSFNVASQTLLIEGTTGTDNISVKATGSLFQVNDNGVNHIFAKMGISSIYANVKTGSSDSLTIDPSVKLPCWLYSEGGYKAKITGGGGKDVISVTGTDNCTLRGGDSDDTIIVKDVSSSDIFGDGGNDRFYVMDKIHLGGNHFDGGAGADSIDYSTCTQRLLLQNGGAGVGVYYTDGQGNAALVNGKPVLFNPVVFSSHIIGMENFTGGQGNDFIYGDNQRNILNGAAGNDFLSGGAGDDTLDGGAGRDALFGGDNNDVLISRDGYVDFLSGGNGFDIGKKDSLDANDSVEFFML